MNQRDIPVNPFNDLARKVAIQRVAFDDECRKVGLEAFNALATTHPDLHEMLHKVWDKPCYIATYLTREIPLYGLTPLDMLATGREDMFRKTLGAVGEFTCA